MPQKLPKRLKTLLISRGRKFLQNYFLESQAKIIINNKIVREDNLDCNNGDLALLIYQRYIKNFNMNVVSADPQKLARNKYYKYYGDLAYQRLTGDFNFESPTYQAIQEARKNIKRAITGLS